MAYFLPTTRKTCVAKGNHRGRYLVVILRSGAETNGVFCDGHRKAAEAYARQVTQYEKAQAARS